MTVNNILFTTNQSVEHPPESTQLDRPSIALIAEANLALMNRNALQPWEQPLRTWVNSAPENRLSNRIAIAEKIRYASTQHSWYLSIDAQEDILPQEFALPSCVTTLTLNRPTIPAGSTLPRVQILTLGKTIIPEGFVIPNSIDTLYLFESTIHQGFVSPPSVTRLNLSGTSIIQPNGTRARITPDSPFYRALITRMDGLSPEQIWI